MRLKEYGRAPFQARGWWEESAQMSHLSLIFTFALNLETISWVTGTQEFSLVFSNTSHISQSIFPLGPYQPCISVPKFHVYFLTGTGTEEVQPNFLLHNYIYWFQQTYPETIAWRFPVKLILLPTGANTACVGQDEWAERKFPKSQWL